MSGGRVCERDCAIGKSRPASIKRAAVAEKRAPEANRRDSQTRVIFAVGLPAKNRCTFLFRVHLSAFNGSYVCMHVPYGRSIARVDLGQSVQRPSARRIVIHPCGFINQVSPDSRCRLANEITERGRRSLRRRMNER